MSVVKECFPQCDFCGETNNDMLHATAAEVRADMVREGWHRVDGGDMCPECWEQRQNEKDNSNDH